MLHRRNPAVGSAVGLAFQLVEQLRGEVHPVLGVGGGMRGREVEQRHGSLLACPVVELVERAVQAPLPVSSVAFDHHSELSVRFGCYSAQEPVPTR